MKHGLTIGTIVLIGAYLISQINVANSIRDAELLRRLSAICVVYDGEGSISDQAIAEWKLRGEMQSQGQEERVRAAIFDQGREFQPNRHYTIGGERVIGTGC